MSRISLPTRRPNVTIAAEWQGHEILVTVGVDLKTGAPIEVFANAAKGGDVAATLADASVLISIALQNGVTPDALNKSLGRVPDLLRGEDATLPASPVGAVMAVVKEVDHDQK
jgi:hypothetical protein